MLPGLLVLCSVIFFFAFLVFLIGFLEEDIGRVSNANFFLLVLISFSWFLTVGMLNKFLPTFSERNRKLENHKEYIVHRNFGKMDGGFAIFFSAESRLWGVFPQTEDYWIKCDDIQGGCPEKLPKRFVAMRVRGEKQVLLGVD